ncbi:SCP2 sterol-binding domain-containing protein [Marinoscillum furvescens]|uniref:SCP-2 sterol transfer family protein n=1 Tax=Marinoscillum furvescens DSM 4134 TaxID=1122208 RepID=A0A3D9L2R8_MARFU|nr:SCP2 sterol-binding domain-containing protein [Marinoscillum furvescens]RED99439.1 SCP-2 sterol transfer family protein [Marinoscillum furvescens DSM 4134]
MTLTDATVKIKGMAVGNEGKVNAKINFQFPEGTIHLDDTVSPTSISNENKEADCTIKMSLDNYGKMLDGKLNPMMAFMAGKMKIEGDKGVAMKLASLF